MSSVVKSKRPFSVLRALAVGTLFVLTAFGCSNIIGLGDYKVAGDAGATGTEAGAPSEAGESSVAGEAGTSSGTGGTSGTAGGSNGEAGSSNGGSAGAGGGSGTTPVGCDRTTSFTPSDQIVRSCILRAGCDPTFDPVRSISQCVTYNTQAALPGEGCNLSSKTCADYTVCEHVGVAHDDLCGGTKTTRCENNMAINCGNYSDGDRFADCTALGGGCGTYHYSDANSTLYADCTMDVGNACNGQPSDDSSVFCKAGTGGADDLRYYCWDNQAYGNSCSGLATCSDDFADVGGGDASCFFNLQHCTTPASPTCNNNVVNDCDSGDLLKYDCTSVGLTCNTTSDGSYYCLAPGCKAADVDTNCTESCSDDGTQLTFCYGGTPYTVTCSDYGFTQCLTGTDTDSDPVAACRY